MDPRKHRSLTPATQPPTVFVHQQQPSHPQSQHCIQLFESTNRFPSANMSHIHNNNNNYDTYHNQLSQQHRHQQQAVSRHVINFNSFNHICQYNTNNNIPKTPDLYVISSANNSSIPNTFRNGDSDKIRLQQLQQYDTPFQTHNYNSSIIAPNNSNNSNINILNHSKEPQIPFYNTSGTINNDQFR